MKSDELLSIFREEMADQSDPYLWSDAAIYRYMNDAQKMFCRLTEGIEDATTTSVCRINVVPGTEWYAISPLITKIRSVLRADTGREIPVVNVEKLGGLGIQFDGRGGVIRYLVSGFQRNKLRAHPLPVETVALNISVFRLPLNNLTAAGQDFEIEEQHIESLLHWMKHKAYDRQDADTVDRVKSEDFKARFEAYCAQARREQERARRVVGAVDYGGIPMNGAPYGGMTRMNRY